MAGLEFSVARAISRGHGENETRHDGMPESVHAFRSLTASGIIGRFVIICGSSHGTHQRVGLMFSVL